MKGKAVRDADLTEKMAFFEAYGALCGDAGVPHLDAILNGKGLSRPTRGLRDARVRRDRARAGRTRARAQRIAAEGVGREGRRRAQRREPRAARRDGRRMTAPRTSAATRRAKTDVVDDSFLRRAGRQLIFAIYGALRAVKLYPVENAAVQKALDDLTRQSKELISSDGELETARSRASSSSSTRSRLRLDLDNFASFSHLLALLRAAGIGTLTIAKAVTAKDWLDLPVDPAVAGLGRPRRATRAADGASSRAAGVTTFTFVAADGHGRRQPREEQGARQAHVRAVGRRDARPDDVGAHGRAARTSRRSSAWCRASSTRS